jgi:hypothetical protein
VSRFQLVAVLTFAAVVAVPSEALAQRSFVGKKLPPLKLVDTEGHTVEPSHYAGSVLVMITGIPW